VPLGWADAVFAGGVLLVFVGAVVAQAGGR
jgi:hypothetical protein